MILRIFKKGIPHRIVLEIDQYKDALYDENIISRKIGGIQKNIKTKAVYRTDLTKRTLSNIHCKMSVQNDKVTCLPLQINNQYM